MIVTVLVPFFPIFTGESGRLTDSASSHNRPAMGAACLWQSGKGLSPKLFLSDFNLEHSDLKQTAFPENTAL